MAKIESTLPVEAWADEDNNGVITRVQIVTGKYMQKFTAVGSITVWYNGVPSASRGMCRNLSHPQKHIIDLRPGETISSMKVYSNLIHKFVCGISVATSSHRSFGPYGLASRMARDVKSPYLNGYYISSLAGSAGDIVTDLRANFACTYVSPFVRGVTGTSDLQLESSLIPGSTTSTISSRGSAGSGYHTDEDILYSSKPLYTSHGHNQFHSELENRLNSMVDQPMKLSDLNRVKGAKPPPPPPRTATGLKSLRTSVHSHIPRKMSRNGSNGSLLTNRPILAKSTTFSSV